MGMGRMPFAPTNNGGKVSNVFSGMGVFIWQVKNCAGENSPETAAAREFIGKTLKTLGVSWAAVKVADGVNGFNLQEVKGMWVDTILPAFFDAEEAAGRKRIGWGYIYGFNPLGEAKRVAEQIKKYGLDGYIIDAEGEYKKAGRAAAATTYMKKLRELCPDTPLALCSFRWPSLHPEFPWKAFTDQMDARKGDVHMPQVYWQGATAVNEPAIQLVRSINELKKIKDLPFIPVGAAYSEHGWSSSRDQIVLFSNHASVLNLPGINWWSLDQILKKVEWQQAVIDASEDWQSGEVVTQDVEPSDVEKLSILWADYKARIG